MANLLNALLALLVLSEYSSKNSGEKKKSQYTIKGDFSDEELEQIYRDIVVNSSFQTEHSWGKYLAKKDGKWVVQICEYQSEYRLKIYKALGYFELTKEDGSQRTIKIPFSRFKGDSNCEHSMLEQKDNYLCVKCGWFEWKPFYKRPKYQFAAVCLCFFSVPFLIGISQFC